MRLNRVILSAVLAVAGATIVAAAEGTNMLHTVYAAKSAWLGLTTDEPMKIQIYEVIFRLYWLLSSDLFFITKKL